MVGTEGKERYSSHVYDGTASRLIHPDTQNKFQFNGQHKDERRDVYLQWIQSPGPSCRCCRRGDAKGNAPLIMHSAGSGPTTMHVRVTLNFCETSSFVDIICQPRKIASCIYYSVLP